MRYRQIAAAVLCCVLLTTVAVRAGDTEDPWRGKRVDEVTAVLGPPDKIKESGETRTLTYRLMLPGVGLVAQYVRQAPGSAENMEFEPTHVDRDGNVVAGGYSPQSSASMSYDPKSGEIERDREEEPDPGKTKKITLKVEFDGDGIVRNWSVSPKKHMKGGGSYDPDSS